VAHFQIDGRSQSGFPLPGFIWVAYKPSDIAAVRDGLNIPV
jgi:hypothetical protein